MKNFGAILNLANHFLKLANDTCFFVDMDETLLFTFDVGPVKEKQMQQEPHGPDFHIVPWGNGNVYACIKRPYADEFLTELNKLGRVSLSTASPPLYAHAMLDACNLTGYFDKIYTGADLTGIQKENCNHFFLIDNSGVGSPTVIDKMKMLGIDGELPEDASIFDWDEEEKNSHYNETAAKMTEHLIQVSDFNGQPGDSDLMPLLDQIKQRLSSTI